MNKHFLIILCLTLLASISNANEVIKDATLKRCNYDSKTINEISCCSFEDVNIKYANLHNANIYQLNMVRGIIAGANFDGAHISNSTFDDVWPLYWGATVKMPNMYVENTTFTDIDFTSVDFSRSHFTSVVFKGCNLNETSLQNSVFKGVKFDNCRIQKVNSQNCIFTDVVFSSCKLGDSDFSGSTFDKVIFTASGDLMGCLNPPKGIPPSLFKPRDDAAISFN